MSRCTPRTARWKWLPDTFHCSPLSTTTHLPGNANGWSCAMTIRSSRPCTPSSNDSLSTTKISTSTLAPSPRMSSTFNDMARKRLAEPASFSPSRWPRKSPSCTISAARRRRLRNPTRGGVHKGISCSESVSTSTRRSVSRCYATFISWILWVIHPDSTRRAWPLFLFITSRVGSGTKRAHSPGRRSFTRVAKLVSCNDFRPTTISSSAMAIPSHIIPRGSTSTSIRWSGPSLPLRMITDGTWTS